MTTIQRCITALLLTQSLIGSTLRLGTCHIDHIQQPIYTNGQRVPLSQLVFEPLSTVSDIQKHSTNELTITIHPTARFDNDHPVGSDDIIHSISQYRHYGYASIAYRTVEQISHISADNPHTLRLEFTQPVTQHTIASIAEIPIIQQHTDQQLHGSGRYLRTQTSPYRVQYQRRTTHWRTDSNPDCNEPEKIEQQYYWNESALHSAFLQHQIDYREEHRQERWLHDYPSLSGLQRCEVAIASPNYRHQSWIVINPSSQSLSQQSVRQRLCQLFPHDIIEQIQQHQHMQRVSHPINVNPIQTQTVLPKELTAICKTDYDHNTLRIFAETIRQQSGSQLNVQRLDHQAYQKALASKAYDLAVITTNKTEPTTYIDDIESGLAIPLWQPTHRRFAYWENTITPPFQQAACQKPGSIWHILLH